MIVVGIWLGEEQSVLERTYSLYYLQVEKKLLPILTSWAVLDSNIK